MDIENLSINENLTLNPLPQKLYCTVCKITLHHILN